MRIKEFYLNEYPTDESGNKINEDATFVGLLWMLQTKPRTAVYDFLGVYDITIVKRVFEELSKKLGLSYTTIYELWLNK